MQVKTRLVLFVLALLCLLLVLGGLAARQLSAMRDVVARVAEQSVGQMDQASRLQGDFNSLRIVSYRHVMELDVDRELALEAEADKLQQSAKRMIGNLLQQPLPASQRQGLLLFRQQFQLYLQQQEKVRSKSASGEMQQALRLASTDATVAAEIAATQLTQVMQALRKSAQAQADQASLAYQAGLRQLGLTLLLAVLLASICAWLFGRSLLKPLGLLANKQQQVAEQLDFRLRLNSPRSDELGLTSRAFDGLLQQLQGSLLQVSAAAQCVNVEVSQLSGSATDTAQRAAMQSQAAGQMSAMVEELSVSIQQIDHRAQDLQTLAQQTLQLAQSGEGVVSHSVSTIEATGRSVEEASHQVRKLHDATQHISSVVAVINDVAEQTNLLALNAAIEAARAGEAGRGFAVVADAVRQLAERTAHSTREIGDTIAAVQQGVLATVENMRAVFSQTSNGITQARQGERVMLDIQQAVRLTQALVEEISAAVREENAAAQDMARRVEQVSRMAEDNHAAASASAGQAQRLQLQADDLQQVVGRYQLQD